MICVPSIRKCLFRRFSNNRPLVWLLGAIISTEKGLAMQSALLSRLESAVEKLLEQNRRLNEECSRLKGENVAWRQEKAELLKEVELILGRIDDLQQEEP